MKRGYKTMLGGSRVEMSASEIDHLEKHIADQDKRRAEAFPTTLAALGAFIDADQRLTALGWKKYTFGFDDGTELAIIERGSTGIFYGFWNKPYFHYADCVSPIKDGVFWKLIADLTDDERLQMNKCSADHGKFMKAQTWSFQAIAKMIEAKP